MVIVNIHPFREGNGRSIREFIRQFVLYKFLDYELDYSKVNKKHFLDAIDDPYTFSSLIAYEFYNALTLKDVKKYK